MPHNQEATTTAKHPETRLPVYSNWCTKLIIQCAFTVTLLQSVAFHKRALKGRTFLIVSLTPAALTLAALQHKVMNS